MNADLASSNANLDEQISQLMQCKPLSEPQVRCFSMIFSMFLRWKLVDFEIGCCFCWFWDLDLVLWWRFIRRSEFLWCMCMWTCVGVMYRCFCFGIVEIENMCTRYVCICVWNSWDWGNWRWLELWMKARRCEIECLICNLWLLFWMRERRYVCALELLRLRKMRCL